MDFKEDGRGVLVVRTAFQKPLALLQEPSSHVQYAFPFSSSFFPCSLTNTPPCLTHQFVSIISYFSFFTLLPNSQFRNLFLGTYYTPVSSWCKWKRKRRCQIFRVVNPLPKQERGLWQTCHPPPHEYKIAWKWLLERLVWSCLSVWMCFTWRELW